jgi:hypothetical protein
MIMLTECGQRPSGFRPNLQQPVRQYLRRTVAPYGLSSKVV